MNDEQRLIAKTQRPVLDEEFEAIIERFENQWEQRPCTSLKNFISQMESIDSRLLTELMRCDMEFQWETGNPRTLADYLGEFSDLEFDRDMKQAVAYEEYRLSGGSGRRPVKQQFEKKYGVSTEGWPEFFARQSGLIGTSDKRLEHNWHLNVAEPKAMKLKPNDRFGDFQIVGKLGQGAQGQVYLATQGQLANRFVVLKVTPPETNEPQILAEMQHTNIMPIFSVHRKEDTLAICMPFLGVATLRDFLQHSKESNSQIAFNQEVFDTVVNQKNETIVSTLRQRTSSASHRDESNQIEKPGTFNQLFAIADEGNATAVLWLGQQLAEGLAWHGHGIIHGDLKPANILISDDGHPLLLDFHLSQFCRGNKTNAIPNGGTLPYMSPEQLQGMNSPIGIDHRSDIFSLGIILFELTTGKLPYPIPELEMQSAIEQMIKDRMESPPSMRSGSSEFNIDLDSIIQRCLEPKPDNRYQSSADLLTDLKRHSNHQPLKFAKNKSILERSRKWAKRHSKLTSVGSIAAASVAVIFVLTVILILRMNQLAQLTAHSQSTLFLEQIQAARIPLTVVGEQDLPPAQAIESALALLDQFGAGDVGQLKKTKRFSHLDENSQILEQEQIAGLNFWLANALRRQAMGGEQERTQKDNHAKPSNAKWFCSQTLMAAHRNQLAKQFTSSASAKIALDLQRERIRDLAKICLQKANLPPEGNLTRQLNELIRSQTSKDMESAYSAGRRSLNESQPISFSECIMMATGILNRPERRPDETSEAIQLLKRAIDRQPNDFAAWLMLGNAHAKNGHQEMAIGCFGVCIALDIENARGYFHRGLAYLELSEFQNALDDFTKVKDLSPDQVGVLFNRHLAAVELGQFDQALADLDSAIDIAGSQPRLYYSRFKLHNTLGNRSEAIADFNKCLTSQPVDETNWISRGLCHFQNREIAKALNDFQKATEINPKSKAALQNIAHIYSEHLDQTDLAIEAMSQIILAEPGSPKPIATRGVLYARLDQGDEAIADAEAALAIAKDAKTCYQVAGIYALMSDDKSSHEKKAISLLARAIRLDLEMVQSKIDGDPDLDSLRDHPDFRKLIEVLKVTNQMKENS